MYDEPGELLVLLAKRSLVLEFCGGITKLEKTLGPRDPRVGPLGSIQVI
jgi:hypothetical protein